VQSHAGSSSRNNKCHVFHHDALQTPENSVGYWFFKSSICWVTSLLLLVGGIVIASILPAPSPLPVLGMLLVLGIVADVTSILPEPDPLPAA
jgi:hypothetical protein